jgi:Mg-chelatase subunit ChlI
MHAPWEQLFPFTALVGQRSMKLALVLNAIDPSLCGVVLRGHKGTAKSTAVRAFAALLPEIEVVQGCPFGCDPDRPDAACAECLARPDRPRARRRPRLETLPLSVTEDRLVGTLDIEHAIQTGQKRFEPGVLARVNRGVLYVDEVNLLDDHVVDVLLDSAAMGVNLVEREGVSFGHPSRFILIGTMNPEEGDLRPQLLDRFGLCVEVESIQDPAERAEIVGRRLDYERDPAAFCARWRPEEQALGAAIEAARRRRGAIEVGPEHHAVAARVSLGIGVDGHRADILAVKAAAALAAFEARERIEPRDFERAAELVYVHRIKRRPFEDRALDRGAIAAAVREAAADAPAREKKKPGPPMT